MQQRLDYIDIAKGLGIILVILDHMVCSKSKLMFYVSAFFVPIFFLCAGFTSSKKNLSLRDNFRRQAIKLLKPYLFFNIILILYFRSFSLRTLLGVLYSRYSLYPLDTNSDICIFFVAGNSSLWFLTCMVMSYLLYYLIIYYPRHQYYIISLYLVATAIMDFSPILLPWSIDTAFLMAIVMYAGTTFRKHFPNAFNNKLPSSIVLLAIVVYLLLLPLCSDINISVRMYGSSMIVYLFAAITGSLLLIAFSRFLQGCFIGKGLQHIGRHSLTIFCIEFPFLFWGEKLSNYFVPHLYLSVTAIIQVIIAITGGYLFSLLLHQNKYIKKLIF